MTLPSSLHSMIPVGPMVPLGVPDEFRRLNDLAYNLWWSWQRDAIDLFRSIDPVAWDRSGNPMAMLHTVEAATWARLAEEEDCVTSYGSVTADFDRYLDGADTWYATNHAEALDGPVAYLCTEFGLHQKLRLYSEGLGILAGDHVKAASDLGIPLVAVGLLYRRGYFRQSVDPSGAQEHTYVRMEVARRPIRQVLDPSTGRPLRVQVSMGDRTVAVGAWHIDVGRVPVILLDTDTTTTSCRIVPSPTSCTCRPRDAAGAGDRARHRGNPGARHARDRAGGLACQRGTRRPQPPRAALGGARRGSRAGTGQEADQCQHVVHPAHPGAGGQRGVRPQRGAAHAVGNIPGIDDELLLSLTDSHAGGQFDMGSLAIRLSSITNGVSKRHGEVVTHEWSNLIGGEAKAITNGVHPQTWVGARCRALSAPSGTCGTSRSSTAPAGLRSTTCPPRSCGRRTRARRP